MGTRNTPLAPFILRNILLPLFIFTDQSLSNLTHKFKLFKFVRYTLVTTFLFFIKIIPSFFPFSFYFGRNLNYDQRVSFCNGLGTCNERVDDGNIRVPGETCIARALAQLLKLINEIPVSSRKYEVVRSYAEKLLDENLEEKYEPLRKVNATVLAGAFARALSQLELAVEAAEPAVGFDEMKSGVLGLNRVMKVWTGFKKGRTGFNGSAEKLAAELLWLTEKMAACGSGDEAVKQWASASKLAYVALSAQLRLQGSLVKLSAYLFKQAASMGGEDDEEGNREELRKIKMKMLMSWIPFLCQASMGIDAPILNFNEKVELENVLGELIGSLKHEEEQEKVLSLWLNHFTHCQSSDWPNLHHYYACWCTTSRKLLILHGK